MARPVAVTFERIGRCHDVPDLVVDLDDSDETIVAALLAHARPYLRSRGFGVDVNDLDVGGVVLFDGGRFGRGRITEVSE